MRRRYGETKRDPARISESGPARRQLWRRVSYLDDSKRLGSRRVTPMCAVHTSFLLTLLTMSNTIGFAKKRVINKTAVPTMFPSKRAVSQRSLSQPLDVEGRLGLAAGPDSERRTPVNKSSETKIQAHLSYGSPH